ncbi:MAG: hypothetical protein H7317_12490 [Pseudorhodobacter sp.]|nr:hypothetical protein [Pseudorhodobacter sp.]
MTKQHLDKLDKKAADAKFDVQAEAQKHKMDDAATKHANKIPGNTEPNAGGVNRERGDRKARTNDRATNGGE